MVGQHITLEIHGLETTPNRVVVEYSAQCRTRIREIMRIEKKAKALSRVELLSVSRKTVVGHHELQVPEAARLLRTGLGVSMVLRDLAEEFQSRATKEQADPPPSS